MNKLMKSSIFWLWITDFRTFSTDTMSLNLQLKIQPNEKISLANKIILNILHFKMINLASQMLVKN